MTKHPTVHEKLHLATIAALPCVICGIQPVHVHHIREGMGMSQRASHYDTLPLCPKHHQHGPAGVAFHASPREWRKNFGSEREILTALRAWMDDPLAPYPTKGVAA